MGYLATSEMRRNSPVTGPSGDGEKRSMTRRHNRRQDLTQGGPKSPLMKGALSGQFRGSRSPPWAVFLPSTLFYSPDRGEHPQRYLARWSGLM
jgi:hypothetical protein